MTNKLYPFNVQKNFHNLLLVRNHLYLNDKVGTKEWNDVEEIVNACKVFEPIAWLTGRQIGLAKRIVILATEIRYEANHR